MTNEQPQDAMTIGQARTQMVEELKQAQANARNKRGELAEIDEMRDAKKRELADIEAIANRLVGRISIIDELRQPPPVPAESAADEGDA